MDADEDFAAGRQVDVHFRDLDDVEHRLAEARQGRFGIEMLTFHLAGIPAYLVVGELAENRCCPAAASCCYQTMPFSWS
jgi:hypothetical protein